MSNLILEKMPLKKPPKRQNKLPLHDRGLPVAFSAVAEAYGGAMGLFQSSSASHFTNKNNKSL